MEQQQTVSFKSRKYSGVVSSQRDQTGCFNTRYTFIRWKKENNEFYGQMDT